MSFLVWQSFCRKRGLVALLSLFHGCQCCVSSCVVTLVGLYSVSLLRDAVSGSVFCVSFLRCSGLVCTLCRFCVITLVGLYSVSLLCDYIGWSVLCVSSSWYPGLVCTLCPFFSCRVLVCALCFFFAVPWVYLCSVSLLEVSRVGLCPVSFLWCRRLVYALCNSFVVP